MASEPAVSTGSLTARCRRCDEVVDITIEIDLTPITQQLDRRLDRIDNALRALHREQEHDMAQLDDELATIEGEEQAEETALSALDADEQRELADLQQIKSGGQPLTDEQEQRLQTLETKLQADTAKVEAEDAAIDAVDPAPAPPADNPPADDAA